MWLHVSHRACQRRAALFVNPGRPITPDTMAIHHILDADVAEAPYWKRVAPQVLRPAGGVAALAAHRAAFEQRYCRPQFTGGTQWVCTWIVCAQAVAAPAALLQQMLGYLRRPKGLDHQTGLPAHRALPDAYVTAHHLRDMQNEAPLDQLLAWSREPGLLPRVPAGAQRGKPWRDLDGEALLAFAEDRDLDMRFSAQTELRRRAGSGPDSPAPFAQLRLV